jgi:ABC-type transport system substrate-binding protein
MMRIGAALPGSIGKSGRDALSYDYLADTSLILRDEAGRPHPAIARSWQTTDRRTWTFTLREGLRAQNGEAFTASRIRDLLLTRQALPSARPFRENLDGIDAPTPTTLVFRLTRPSQALFETLGVAHLAGDVGRPEWLAGPLRAVRDTPEEISFEPWPYSWNGPPTVGGVTVRFFPTPRAAWAAFLRNDVDVFYDVPPEALPLLAENQDVQLVNVGWSYIYTLMFQQRHPLLRDVRVRRALNLAIDREAIARRLFGKFTASERGPFSPRYWAAAEAGSAWRYDPAAARALLRAATAGRKTPIELSCLTVDQFPLSADMVSALEAQLALVHVRLRIVTVPLEEFSRRLTAGDFELSSSPFLAAKGTSRASMFWRSQRQMFDSHYSAADAELDAHDAAGSDDEERAAVRAVLDVMHRDPPAVFVMPIPSIRAVRRKWRVAASAPSFLRSLPYWTLAETPPCGPR